jgi:hypothetical protein
MNWHEALKHFFEGVTGSFVGTNLGIWFWKYVTDLWLERRAQRRELERLTGMRLKEPGRS